MTPSFPLTAMTSEANISAIARHRFDTDGKGVRTLIAFEGCPLRCRYCINSFTWDGSRRGTRFTPQGLLDAVSVDSVYFRATGGGLTFGGGEPLLHARFITELVRIAPDFWNYVVETSLAVPFENIKAVADSVDRFAVDIKSLDEATYSAYTGGELSLARDNLIKLLDLTGAERITVRAPFIPEYADKESQMRTVEELRRLGITHIDAFGYKVK